MRIAILIFSLIAQCAFAQMGFMESRIGGTNLVGWWTFNGGVLTNDSSGFANNCTNFNAYSTNGIIGLGLGFTSSNYLSVNSQIKSFVSGSSNATLVGWAKGNIVFGFNPTNNASGERFSTLVLGNTAYFSCESGGQASFPNCLINTNNYNYFSMVLSNGILFAFTNGVSAVLTNGGVTPSAKISTNLPNFTIGGMTNLSGGGIIDDIRIFNRALSASEISQLYNNGKGTQK